MNVDVVHSTSKQVTIKWTGAAKNSFDKIKLKDILDTDIKSSVCSDEAGEFECRNLIAGEIYTVEFCKGDKLVKQVDVDAYFCKTELQVLFEKALVMRRNVFRKISCLYRNKPQQYYQLITSNGGIEFAYLKDLNGDQGNPINRKIKGLFFNGKVSPNGAIPNNSPFGDIRFCVPVHQLFSPANRLFFCDFYCTSPVSPHYVTLVITTRDTFQEEFCIEHLLELDIFDNEYFYISSNGAVLLNHSKGLQVELFYANDVDLHLGELFPCATFGRGSSTYWGIVKTPNCKVCNLYDENGEKMEGVEIPERFADDDDDEDGAPAGESSLKSHAGKIKKPHMKKSAGKPYAKPSRSAPKVQDDIIGGSIAEARQMNDMLAPGYGPTSAGWQEPVKTPKGQRPAKASRWDQPLNPLFQGPPIDWRAPIPQNREAQNYQQRSLPDHSTPSRGLGAPIPQLVEDQDFQRRSLSNLHLPINGSEFNMPQRGGNRQSPAKPPNWRPKNDFEARRVPLQAEQSHQAALSQSNYYAQRGMEDGSYNGAGSFNYGMYPGWNQASQGGRVKRRGFTDGDVVDIYQRHLASSLRVVDGRLMADPDAINAAVHCLQDIGLPQQPGYMHPTNSLALEQNYSNHHPAPQARFPPGRGRRARHYYSYQPY